MAARGNPSPKASAGASRRQAAGQGRAKAHRRSGAGTGRQGADARGAIDDALLIGAARDVRARAYAPYSGYPVGAALLADDGRVFVGVNVENSAYPSGLCAEHNAVGRAVASGARAFRAIAVVTELDRNGQSGSPCGKCRQVLSEFGLDLVVLLAGPSGDPVTTTLRELLPRAFSSANL